MQFYRIFDLVTKSELLLPETEPISQRQTAGVDVDISFGETSFDLTSHPKTQRLDGHGSYCFPEDGRFSFRSHGVELEVSGGARIVIASHKLAHHDTKLHTLLLGTAFGVLSMQRGHIPIHGAALEHDGGAIIITGYSGAGKSAMLGALIEKGYRYLADDVSVVSLARGLPEVLPAYPQRKLSVDTAAELNCNIAGLPVITEDCREKYVIRRTEEWFPQRLPLRTIVELTVKQGAEDLPPSAELIPARGRAGLEVVLRNLYRRFLYHDTGIAPQTMKQILEITAAAQVLQAIRPVSGFPPAELAQQISQAVFDSGR